MDGTIRDDTLIGGGGNDVLQGGDGNDTYVFELGWGSDSIGEFPETATTSTRDTIMFGEGIASDDITVARQDGHLFLTHSNGDQIQVFFQFYALSVNSPTTRHQIEEVHFSDGTVWNLNDLHRFLTSGTPENDYIVGNGTAETLDGGAGNDHISGYGASDTITGGAGDDRLYGGQGVDFFHYGLGWGNDTILPFDRDIVVFHLGILPDDITLSRVGSDLLVTHTAGDSILFDNLYYPVVGNDLFEIRFENGTVWTIDDIVQMANVPSIGDDYLVGDGVNNDIDGLAGNDTIVGTDGDDSLFGNDGNDTISGARGNDTLLGGDGDDFLSDGFNDGDDDSLSGGAGNDTLLSGFGDDVLSGGTGNDRLEGNDGDDVYLFSLGWGNDTIADNDPRIASGITSSFDILRFDASVLHTDITIERVGDHLILRHVNGEQIRIVSQFDSHFAQIDEIHFADGTVWTEASIRLLLNPATTGDDNRVGGEGADLIVGLDGNDSLSGLNGDDTLSGDAGDDRLVGGEGADTYLFELGWGNDTISDTYSSLSASGSSTSDVLMFGAGIQPDDFTATRVGNDVLLTHVSGSTILLQSYLFRPTDGITVDAMFADGTVWTSVDIESLLLAGSEGDDSIIGFDRDEEIFGLAGDDTIRAGEGNDTIGG